MIGRRELLVGLLAAGLPVPGAQAQEPIKCPSTPPTWLVKPHPRRAALDRAPASPEDVARALAAVPDRRRVSARLGPSGAILAEFNYEIRLILTSNDQPLRTCVVLSVAEVELHIETHTILLASDAAPGAACRREALVAAAERHGQINLDALADAHRRVDAVLAREIPLLKPIVGTTRNPALVTRAYKRILTGPVEAALDAALAAAHERHGPPAAALDAALRRCG